MAVNALALRRHDHFDFRGNFGQAFFSLTAGDGEAGEEERKAGRGRGVEEKKAHC